MRRWISALRTCSGLACGGGGSYERDYTYTGKLPPCTQTIKMESASYWSRPLYDSLAARVATVRCFSGYSIDKVYNNSTGYLSQMTDDTTGFVIWQADARDAELHLALSEVGGGPVKRKATTRTRAAS